MTEEQEKPKRSWFKDKKTSTIGFEADDYQTVVDGAAAAKRSVASFIRLAAIEAAEKELKKAKRK